MGAAKTPDNDGDEETRLEDRSHFRAYSLVYAFLNSHTLDDSVAIERLVAEHPDEEHALRSILRNLHNVKEHRARAEDGDTGDHSCDTDSPDAVAELFARIRHDFDRGTRFTAGDRIGSGGIGVVFKLWDAGLRRYVAKKTVRADKLRSNPTQRFRWIVRFLEEAQITAQLDHPGVVPIHDLGFEPDGQIYFTMRYVRGETFADAIQKAHSNGEGWNRTRAVSTLLRVCETMAFAHGKDVIHRDLKPSNVMVGRYGETYVMDWGLARKLGEPDLRDLRIRPTQQHSTEVLTDARQIEESGLFTVDGHLIGTPAYTSPEQARGDIRQIGKATDVYALGAILYEILAGHPPYLEPGVRTDGATLCRWVIDGPPAKIHSRAPDAPAELVAICERAMARDPAKRYPAVEEMAEDVRAFLENRVVKAHRTGPFTELTKWVARNRLAAGIAAALVISAFAGSLALFTTERGRRHLEQLIADGVRVDRLLDEGAALPVHGPGAVERLDAWIARAEDVLSRRADRLARFEALVAKSTGNEGPIDASLELDHRNAAIRVDELSKLIPHAGEEGLDIQGQVDALMKQRDFLAEQVRFDSRYTLTREDELEELRNLGTLLRSLTLLEFDDHGLLPRIRVRRQGAHESANEEARRRETSNECFPAVNAISPGIYRSDDFERTPPGLEFLRVDPQSRLAEYWYKPSGDVPEFKPDGPLRIKAKTALVFVLVPRGAVTMGYQSDRPDDFNFRKQSGSTGKRGQYVLELPSFFLSKYEMTQDQWFRLSGVRPSSFPIGMRDSLRSALGLKPRFVDGSHPVETITHSVARRHLMAYGMRLPTNAEWVRVAFVDDVMKSKEARVLGNLEEVDWDNKFNSYKGDGYLLHAPVGSFPPNSLGFFDMIGNVAELVDDPWVDWPTEVGHDHLNSSKRLVPTIQFGSTICGSSILTSARDVASGVFSSRYRSTSEEGGQGPPRAAGIRPAFTKMQ